VKVVADDGGVFPPAPRVRAARQRGWKAHPGGGASRGAGIDPGARAAQAARRN